MFFKNNLSRRLSAYVSALCGVVLFVALISIYLIVRDSTIKNASANAQQVMQIIKAKTEQMVVDTEYATQELVWHIGRCKNNRQVVGLVQHLLQTEAIIGSIAIVMHFPAHSTDRLHIASYITRAGDSTNVEHFQSTDQYTTQEWYKKTKANDQAIWCAPWDSSGHQRYRMVCYAAPIKNSEGTTIGVCSINLELDWIINTIRQVKPYPESEITITTSDGYEFCSPTSDDGIDNVAKKETISFHQKLGSSNWSISLICSKEAIFAQLTQLNLMVSTVMILGLLLLYFVVRFVVQRTTAPLVKFTRAAHHIATGDFDAPLPVIKYHDELYTLGESINDMQHALKEHIEQLRQTTASKERFENELAIAADIQRSMLNSSPEAVGHFDVCAHLAPARQVGGDLYDVLTIDDRIWFIVGDVSGKGVAASLYMSVVVFVFRTFARQLKDLPAVVSAINNALARENRRSMFVTALLGVVDTQTGQIELCNAGHNPPIIKDDQGARFVKQPTNMAMGVVEQVDYSSTKYPFQANASLLVYTDGITESRGAGQEEFGECALLELVDVSQNYAPALLIQEVVEAIALHSGSAEQSDDITLLAITHYHLAIEFAPTIDSIGLIAPFVAELSTDQSHKIRLSIEELVVNAINYAQSPTPIRLSAIKIASKTTATIQYGGVAFDPLAAAPPSVDAPIDERTAGGLGILLARQMSDQIVYHRAGDLNILVLEWFTSTK